MSIESGRSSAPPFLLADSKPASMNRAQRRIAQRKAHTARRRTAWRTGFVATAATVALLAGISASPAYAGALGDVTIGGVDIKDFAPTNPGQESGGVDIDVINKLLDNPIVGSVAQLCRTGLVAGDSTSNLATSETATADCSQSGGTGLAVVLPPRIDAAGIADRVVINLGPDINVLVHQYRLGERTFIDVIGAAAIDPNSTVAGLVAALGYGRIDPINLGKYSTFADVAFDAALPVELKTERYCGTFILFSNCVGGAWRDRTVDTNLGDRSAALRVAQFLTGATYDLARPMVFSAPPAPSGSATLIGGGYNFAIAANGGNATAQTDHEYGVAVAGADAGAASARSLLGLAVAANLNTDQIALTWFDQALDFSRLREAGVLNQAGPDADSLLSTVENFKLPAVKEVACLGVIATATASGLGECANYLGTFDYYKDTRDPIDGQSRQTQWGLTDPTSLLLGKDSFLREAFGDDASTFLESAMGAAVSEDTRLKLIKDFLRFTEDVKTTETRTPTLDENNDPVLDDEGQPTFTLTSSTETKYLLTSDYGLRNPVAIDWLGYRLTLFPAVEVNGTVRPNYLGMPTITKIDDESAAGLLPEIGLMEWDNAFGLGTVPITPLDPIGALTSAAASVTIVDDIKLAQETLSGATVSPPPAEPSDPNDGTQTDSAGDVTIEQSAPPALRPTEPSPRQSSSTRSYSEEPTRPAAPDATTREVPVPETPAATPEPELLPETSTTPAPPTTEILTPTVSATVAKPDAPEANSSDSITKASTNKVPDSAGGDTASNDTA